MSLELSRKIADRLHAPLWNVQAVEEVESSGVSFMDVDGDGKVEPLVRHEAHHFGKCTGYQFNESHPQISSRRWNPDLAARTYAGAWAQHREAAALNEACAKSSASIGKYQVMGFNWERLNYPSVDALWESMWTEEGQAEAFARYIEADPTLHQAIIAGDFQTVETRYNGGGYGGAYAVKLKAAAQRYRAGAKDAGKGSAMAPRVLRLGDTGPDVAELQRALAVAGHAPGPIDGAFGQMTQAAVLAFQAAQGLKADGLAGMMTKSWLGLIK